jgi:hypothetical protein
MPAICIAQEVKHKDKRTICPEICFHAHEEQSSSIDNDASRLGTNPKIRVRVELRANEMYELRSREHGSAEQDWLRAEAEVLSQRE